jgi:hypothetical protein
MRKNTCIGLAAMGFALQGCASGADMDTAEGAGAEADAVVLASFELSNGNTVTLTGLPGLGEILVNENAPAGGGEQFLIEDQPAAGPLELFARLTPAGTPVPQMIHDLASDEERATWLGKREVVAEPAAETFEVDIAELGWTPITILSGGSCDPVTGQQYFEDNHCGTMGPYGYGVTETDCDSGMWLTLQRTSADTMRHTYTRIAACNGTGRIRHSRDTISGFETVLDELVPANSVASYYSYRTGLKHYRRARFERYDPYDDDAYVRGWTRFFDQVTENAP